MLKDEPVKFSNKQLKEEKKSTMELFNEMKDKVKENHSAMKEDKKKERGKER